MDQRQRLSRDEAQRVLDTVVPIPIERGASPIPRRAIEGADLTGKECVIALDTTTIGTLLLFLSLRCQGCDDLFAALSDHNDFGVSADEEIVVVVKTLNEGEEEELLARLGTICCVVSHQAFDDYGVSGPPFFTFIDPAKSSVATEGVAWGVDSIKNAVQEAKQGEVRLESVRLSLENPNS